MDKMKRTDMTKKTDRTKKDSTAASNPQFWAWVHIFLKFTANFRKNVFLNTMDDEKFGLEIFGLFFIGL